MLIDFKIRALFIWTDPYLPDLANVHTVYVVLLSFRKKAEKPFLASFFQSKNLDCSDHRL